MFALAWLSNGLILKSLDDQFVNFSAKSPVHVVKTPVGYVLVDPTTGKAGILEPSKVQTLVCPWPFDGNPKTVDPKWAHFIIGEGSIVQGVTVDELSVSIMGDMFYTCTPDELLVYKRTDEGVERHALKRGTVQFGPGTCWWSTDQTLPFEPTDCEIGSDSHRK